MTTTPAAGTTLRERLTIIQHTLKAPKVNKSPMGYSYRSCEDILEGLKPILYEQGVTLVLSDSIELIGSRYYVKATATLSLGAESVAATAYAREEEERRGTDASKITGAASSYARKYALNGLFCIDDTKDADAQENPKPVSKAPVTKPAEKPAEKKPPTVTKVMETLTAQNLHQPLNVAYDKALTYTHWTPDEVKSLADCYLSVYARLSNWVRTADGFTDALGEVKAAIVREPSGKVKVMEAVPMTANQEKKADTPAAA